MTTSLTIQLMAKWIRERTDKSEFTDAACLSWAEELYVLAHSSEYSNTDAK